MINVTFHAEKRARERFNWTKDELVRHANAALEAGALVTDDPFLKELFRKSILFHKESIYYYREGAVFVFEDDRLVTVYPINGRYTRTK